MYKFGKNSRRNLDSCDPRLQAVFEEVIKHLDCAVIEGHRGQNKQNHLYRVGKSKLCYPNSKHNQLPSKAIDIIPYPVDWEDKERFIRFAHFSMGVAAGMGITLRWGGDWDRDWDLLDNRFNDYPHFEIVEEE